MVEHDLMNRRIRFTKSKDTCSVIKGVHLLENFIILLMTSTLFFLLLLSCGILSPPP